MARKIIIDCDPGISDAVAICMSLFDSRLEVIAVTAASGAVTGQQASRNVQSMIEHLDPPRWPRLGMAQGHDSRRHGQRVETPEDTLGGIGLPVTELHRNHPSDKMIVDAIRNAPGEVTIITLGPLTNIAAAFNRDPELASLVHRIIISGGTVNGIGNVTPAAEFNLYFDPEAARIVFRSIATKTLVPLEVGTQIVWNLSLLDDLPDESSRVGNLLHKIIPNEFRLFRREYGLEGIYLHDAITIAAVLHPEFFEMTELAGDVETSGELTSGASIFDRRPRPEGRKNMEVVTSLDVRAVTDAIIQGLRFAGQESRD